MAPSARVIGTTTAAAMGAAAVASQSSQPRLAFACSHGAAAPVPAQRVGLASAAAARPVGRQNQPQAFAGASVGRLCAVAAATVTAAAARWRGGRRSSAAVARRARGGAEDYYQVLGLSRSCTEKEVKANFRKLARQYHPDVNKEPGAQEKFQSIARAYEVLQDAQKRQRYDQFGEAGVSGGMGGGGGPDLSGMNLEDILGDVFGSFFGGGGGMGGMGGMGGRGRRGVPQGPQKGSDLQSEVTFPFEVACFGGERKIQVRREETCQPCTGSGIRAGAGASKCSQCNGMGVVVQVMQTPLGVMQTQGVCPACTGGGIDPSAFCSSCRGKGTKPEVKEVTVKVPAGCNQGNQLRVRGEGDKGQKSGPAGDLYIAVSVNSSTDFEREGFDIYTESNLNIFDAMLGTTLNVKTIDGDAEIKVPAGTQPETRMRIRGRGVPKLGKPNERGDHYVTIKVTVPRSLNSEQTKLVQELKTLES